jgi:hypothetical protein
MDATHRRLEVNPSVRFGCILIISDVYKRDQTSTGISFLEKINFS